MISSGCVKVDSFVLLFVALHSSGFCPGELIVGIKITKAALSFNLAASRDTSIEESTGSALLDFDLLSLEVDDD